jgi:8-oxo-dGTP diphosphatase
LVPRTLIFLTRAERVLLIKGAQDKRLWAGKYNGIGGHIERGEDVLGAAQRELREETGLSVYDLQLCGVIIIDAGGQTGIGIYVLRGECPEGKPRPSQEGELAWIPRSQLESLPLVEDLPTLLPRVLNMKPGEPPFSARYSYDENDQLRITFASQEG